MVEPSGLEPLSKVHSRITSTSLFGIEVSSERIDSNYPQSDIVYLVFD